MMHLVAPLVPIGTHLGAWRHPDAWDETVINWAQLAEIARMAEAAKFDALFLADGNAVRDMDDRALFEAMSPAARPVGFEPLTLLSSLAAVTRHIGLVATSTTSFDEPYAVARRFASLDHISGGRAGWNVVTSSFDGDALNFSRAAHLPKAERYERAREFVDVAFALWDSWDADAFPQDRKNARYLDAGKVRSLDHQGPHFQVRGPLNVARSPQGRPVIFHAGQSDGGRALAAHAADCIFAMTPTKEAAIAHRSAMLDRAEALGRPRDSLRVIPGMSLYIGRSLAEAEDRLAELNALIPPALGLGHLSKLLYHDLRGCDVEAPMPSLPEEVSGVSAMRGIVNRMVETEAPTIRQVYERFLPTLGHPVFKGGPVEIADQMEDWYRDGACDGFLVIPAIMPTMLRLFAEEVVPELQRRGLFRRDYPDGTLRDVMDLTRYA